MMATTTPFYLETRNGQIRPQSIKTGVRQHLKRPTCSFHLADTHTFYCHVIQSALEKIISPYRVLGETLACPAGYFKYLHSTVTLTSSKLSYQPLCLGELMGLLASHVTFSHYHVINHAIIRTAARWRCLTNKDTE